MAATAGMPSTAGMQATVGKPATIKNKDDCNDCPQQQKRKQTAGMKATRGGTTQ
jgi:hypothetical protein